MRRHRQLACVLLAVSLTAFSVTAGAQTQYDTSPSAQTGVQSYGSYFSADIDTVGLYNGNLMLNISLFSMPGRELSMGLALNYNSQEWEKHDCPDGSGGTFQCGKYTGGWRIANPFGSISVYTKWLGTTNYGTYCQATYEMNVYWLNGMGTKHRYKTISIATFSNCSNPPPAPGYNGLTLDGVDDRGKIIMASDWTTTGKATIYFPDGKKLEFLNNEGDKITTPNGNYLVQSTNGSKLPAQDTLGRTVTFSAGTIGSTPDVYSIKDANGATQNYSIQYKTMSVWDPQRTANNTQTIGSTKTVVDSITLPNGKQWLFEYAHEQGFLTKATFPTGAYLRFVYAGGSVQSAQRVAANDFIIERRLSPDGSTEQAWSHVRTGVGGVTIVSPEGDAVEHSFNSYGQEVLTRWRATQAGAILKTVSPAWTQNSVESNYQPNNARRTQTVTTLDNGLSSTRTLTYGTGSFPPLVYQDEVTGWGTSTVVSRKAYNYTQWNDTTSPVAVYGISIEYFEAINPTTGSFALQGKKEYFYDEYSLTNRGTSVPNNTNSSSQTYRGNVTRIRAYKDSNNYVDTLTKYDTLGNAVETIDPLNNSTAIDFTDSFFDAPLSHPLTFAYSTKVTNALGQYTTKKYDFNTGLPEQAVSLRGYTTTTGYDSLNRVTSVTEPNGKQTTYSYNDNTRVTTKEVTVDSSGNKGHVETSFDKLYRVVQTRTNDPEGTIYSDTVYDNKGRAKKTSNPYRSGETVAWTETAFDSLDRPASVTAPDGSVVRYAYANNVTTTTDQGGNQRRYTYDSLGHLVTVEEPNPTLSTPLTTTYTYYGFGILYRSNQSNQLRTWTNNWLGQMTSEALPESGTTTFTYDAAGRLSTKTDARNIVTTLNYDNINRLTSQTYSDSTPTVSFTYDGSSQTGQRTGMTDGLGSVTYTYDNMDRLTQEQRDTNWHQRHVHHGLRVQRKGRSDAAHLPERPRRRFHVCHGRRVLQFPVVGGQGQHGECESPRGSDL